MTPTANPTETIAVTGGAGYIGSHAVKLLLEAGRRVLIIDNLTRGSQKAIDALQTIAEGRLTFLEADIADPSITAALRDYNAKAVMHFAALAYVRESVEKPLDYHTNNTAAATHFLQACAAANVTRFVFSSTCATYGSVPQDQIPITESTPTQPINPYGWSKLTSNERALIDYGNQHPLRLRHPPLLQRRRRRPRRTHRRKPQPRNPPHPQRHPRRPRKRSTPHHLRP